MKYRYYLLMVVLSTLLLLSCEKRESSTAPSVRITLSMNNPESHYYQVEMHCSGLNQNQLTLKLPAWTPGYYLVLDLSQNVVDFSPLDSAGRVLEWSKTDKNAWSINTTGLSSVIVNYYVYANRRSVAEPYLDSLKGFISPTGIFMHPDKYLSIPVELSINLWKDWSKISTGLAMVEGNQNTYRAEDYDELYDSPILVGNQTIAQFEVQNIPHYISIENVGEADLEKLKADLKQIVETSERLMGDIPYNQYDFLIMEQGGGGLEHRNSMAVYSRVSDYPGTGNQTGWLGFMAHEYFHLFNIKSIRPIVLGPFNYDKENLTQDLWLSEGGTVYYQEIILNRGGFTDANLFLKAMERNIRNHENIPGHLFQSVGQSSWDTWINFFSRSANSRDVTISYYDKGCTIAMLTDLAIRNGSKNKKSLDDVMRTLYYDYHQKKNRGFTSEELRHECEKAARTDLSEIFETYIPTTAPIDYSKYLAYAGLKIDLSPDGPERLILGKKFQKKKFEISKMDQTTEMQDEIFRTWAGS